MYEDLGQHREGVRKHSHAIDALVLRVNHRYRHRSIVRPKDRRIAQTDCLSLTQIGSQLSAQSQWARRVHDLWMSGPGLQCGPPVAAGDWPECVLLFCLENTAEVLQTLLRHDVPAHSRVASSIRLRSFANLGPYAEEACVSTHYLAHSKGLNLETSLVFFLIFKIRTHRSFTHV